MTSKRVALVGNPNSGKSTLFNRLTGGSAKVGNYPGITVERSLGAWRLPGGQQVTAIDVPGAYSLSARSPEERIAFDEVLGVAAGGAAQRPDALVVVVDAPRLQRGLYLLLQLLELEIPIVVAMNMMDEARAEGVAPDLAAVSRALGVPVVGVVGRTGEGLDALAAAVERALAAPVAPGSPARWSDALLKDADALVAAMREVPGGLIGAVAPPAGAAGPPSGPERALAVWALMSVDDASQAAGVVPLAALEQARSRAVASGRDLDAEIVQSRYLWIDAHVPGFVSGAYVTRGGYRIDALVMHPIGGAVVFVAVMLVVFLALFSWSDPLIGLIEAAFAAVGDVVGEVFALAPGAGSGGVVDVARDLVVDGIIGGVGSVVVFVPQIGLLFLFLALLEDCGYLARAATWMDRVLRFAGLPGHAFVPLLSGFACAVPAIVATRTLSRRRDRLLAMAVLPLTSCSARLPVYALVIGAVLPASFAALPGVPVRPLVLFAMYTFSAIVTLVAAVVIGRLVLAEPPAQVLLELPPWRAPQPRVVARLVWSRVAGFLREAGGVILAATIVLWALLYFPRVTPEEVLSAEVIARSTPEQIEELTAAAGLERSFAGTIGKTIEPVIAPLGFDWRIGVGLVGAFAAREVFVSTLGVVYGIADADEESQSLREHIQAERRPDGTPVWSARTGLSLMVFFALAMQCMSTLAVLRRESGSWSWTAFVVVYPTAMAWVGSFVVYQGLGLLGWSG